VCQNEIWPSKVLYMLSKARQPFGVMRFDALKAVPRYTPMANLRAR